MNKILDTYEIKKEQNRLASTYGITNVHAGCYMCNFDSKYICEEHNGGCSSFEKCKEIHAKEQV